MDNLRLRTQLRRVSLRAFLLLTTVLPSLFAYLSVDAQILEFEQNPPHLQWRQIHTPNFQVIFPSSFEHNAQRLSSQLEEMIRVLDRRTGRSRRTPIVLQNQSVLSNGFVQLAPRRSEFVTTPAPESQIGDWLDQLAVHELQHIVQFDRLVGQFRAPFLEQLGMAFYGLTLPAWYFEGDAVWIETRITGGGRGRIPSWSMPYRANLLSGKQYSYQKDYLGSYKDVTPGFYEMGYFMVEKLYRDYGVDMASKMMDRMSGNLLRPYNFSRTLRRYTGYTTRQWHRETVNELRSEWQAALDTTAYTDYPLYPSPVSAGKPASWLLPQALPNGQILVLRQGVGNTSAIICLNEDGDPAAVSPIQIGPQNTPNFYHARSRLVWDEIRRNPRYAKQTFSVINTYDLESGFYRQLTRGTRFFSPVLHPEGGLIACVEISDENQAAIVFLDWQDGQVQKRFPAPHSRLTLHTPAFRADGKRIVMVATSPQGTTLLELDPDRQQYIQLIPWQVQQLERPVYQDNDVFFKAHYDGIDNIYKLVREDGNIYQLTHTRYGAFNPSIDTARRELLFNNYTPEGHRISRLPFDDLSLAEITPPIIRSPSRQPLPLAGQAESNSSDDPWESRPYREASHLLNFHSLSVTSGDFSDPDSFQPGIYWLSDNLLNTLQTRLGYTYDSNIRSSEYSAGFTYQRYYPVFDISFSNRGNTGVLVRREDQTAGLSWRENHLNIQVRIPLVFFKRHRIYGLTGSIGTQFTGRYNLSIASDHSEWIPSDTERRQVQDNFVHQIRFPLRYTLSFSHMLRRSALDLGPRWGQSFSLAYRHTPFGPVSQGNNTDNRHFALRSAFYFPGIVRHHSLLAQFSYQSGQGAYNMVNNIPLVSGFDQLTPEPVENTLLINYRFPLAYPDWEIGALAYIKRIKGGVFADFQNVFVGSASANQPRTIGLELRSDLNLLRFVLPNFDIGAKLIYVNQDARISGRMLMTYGIGYSY